MSATLVVTEYNGAAASPTRTDLPSNGGVIQYASVDQPSTTANLSTGNGISPGNFSMEKFHTAKVTTVAPTSFDSLSVKFSDQAPTDSAAGATVTVKYGTTAAYATPKSALSTIATTASRAGAPSVGATATLPVPANAVNAYSAQFLVTQLGFSAAAALGDAVFAAADQTWTYSYH